MKPDKKQFIERLVKLSYHAHRIEITFSETDKKYLDMLLVRDNLKFLYHDEEQGTKNPESD